MSLKDRTNKVLLDAYKAKGFRYALSLAEGIVKANHNKPMSERNVVVGEICEAVLAVCISEYMRLNPERTKGWFFTNQFIIGDMETRNPKFLTEIDFVLFTPSKALLFECKGYIGDKVIVDKGTITRKGRENFDVYEQHRNHALTFSRMFGHFRMSGVPEFDCYQLAVFLFCTGSIEDKRNSTYKKVLPFVEVDGLFKLLSEIDTTPRFQMDYVRRAVDIVESKKDALVDKHLAFVKSRHSSKQSNNSKRRS